MPAAISAWASARSGADCDCDLWPQRLAQQPLKHPPSCEQAQVTAHTFLEPMQPGTAKWTHNSGPISSWEITQPSSGCISLLQASTIVVTTCTSQFCLLYPTSFSQLQLSKWALVSCLSNLSGWEQMPESKQKRGQNQNWEPRAGYQKEGICLHNCRSNRLNPPNWREAMDLGAIVVFGSKIQAGVKSDLNLSWPTAPTSCLETFLEIWEDFLSRQIGWSSLCSEDTDNWGHRKVLFLLPLCLYIYLPFSLYCFLLLSSFFIIHLILIFYFFLLKILLFLNKLIYFSTIYTVLFHYIAFLFLLCFWFYIFASLVFIVIVIWVCLLVAWASFSILTCLVLLLQFLWCFACSLFFACMFVWFFFLFLFSLELCS